ncbi:hypothetical protein BU17DRAFT_98235 [Hysterangium stoloniferum]|nr:hypothetical protein BU17DRAFT_98235 [Hysterangium stoloniferum]
MSSTSGSPDGRSNSADSEKSHQLDRATRNLKTTSQGSYSRHEDGCDTPYALQAHRHTQRSSNSPRAPMKATGYDDPDHGHAGDECFKVFTTPSTLQTHQYGHSALLPEYNCDQPNSNYNEATLSSHKMHGIPAETLLEGVDPWLPQLY